MLFKLFLDKLVEHLYFQQEGNLALYDRLTSVYNYNWFNLIGNNKYTNKVLFVTVIDINGFKQINDTKGHLYGNQILKQVAEKLVSFKCYDNTIDVVRYGGDEFVIISELDPSNILDRYANSEQLISFGIVKKEAFEPLSVAFVKADEKMYRFKQEFKKKQKLQQAKKSLAIN